MNNPSSLGKSAGMLLLSPSLNPYGPNTEEESLWDRGWKAAVAEVLMARDAERRRKRGLLGVSACGNPADYLKEAM